MKKFLYMLSSSITFLLFLILFSSTSFAAQSDTIAKSNITITNNYNTDDTIAFTNMNIGDIVFVYPTLTSNTILCGIEFADTTETMTIPDLGEKAGILYISRIESGKTESKRVSLSYSKEPVSTAPSSSSITITNNYIGTNDTITVDDIVAGDIINVYTSENSETVIGSAQAEGNSVTINIFQIGKNAGYLYITRMEAGKHESPRRVKQFQAESLSDTVDLNDILIVNNYEGTDDVITVNNVNIGDIVSLYRSNTDSTSLKSIIAEDTSVQLSVPQLGIEAGILFVSVQESGKWESKRLKASYAAEPITDISSLNVTVNNYTGTDTDSIDLSGLQLGTLVNIYSNIQGGKLLESATAIGATLNIPTTKLKTAGGYIYVSIKENNKWESERVEIEYTSEISSDIAIGNVTIVNNKDEDDTITITGLLDNDEVNIYENTYDIEPIATETAVGNTAEFSIPQLGALGGNIYISVQSPNKRESQKVPVSFESEPVSAPLAVENITVTNNYIGTADKIIVSGVESGDIINIYLEEDDDETIATMEATDITVVIEIEQLDSISGNIYVSVTKPDLLESEKTAITFASEPITPELKLANVSIINNSGNNDTLTVIGIESGDVIYVYPESIGDTPIASGTGTDITIDIPIELDSNAGSLYVSIKKPGMWESKKINVPYLADSSAKISPTQIAVTNNYIDIEDTVIVSGLGEDYIVYVYESLYSTKPIGTTTSVAGVATINIQQLGINAGNVYVTVAEPNKTECERIKQSYQPEPTSAAISSSNISIENNYLSVDTITISALEAEAQVFVYTSLRATTPIAVETAEDTSLVIYIDQLGEKSGNIYLTVKYPSKHESSKTLIKYNSEQTTSLSTKDIKIVNNFTGTNDTITISNLKIGDIVKVYTTYKGTKVLAKGTADSNNLILSIKQLGASSGKLYISITSLNKKESTRTTVSFNEEPVSSPITSNNISVKVNSSGICKVVISKVNAGDIIKIYSSSKSYASLLATSVATSNTVTFNLDMDEPTGVIYISITSPGMWESSRTPKAYR